MIDGYMHCDICEGLFSDSMKGGPIPNIGWMCDSCYTGCNTEVNIRNRLEVELTERITADLEEQYIAIRETNTKLKEVIEAQNRELELKR